MRASAASRPSMQRRFWSSQSTPRKRSKDRTPTNLRIDEFTMAVGYIYDGDHYKFTGKERDSESGLDMFGSRYYTSAMGRFMIPDWSDRPVAVPYANVGNPQTLNL